MINVCVLWHGGSSQQITVQADCCTCCSERVFAAAGLTIAKDQARLSPENSYELVFLHDAEPVIKRYEEVERMRQPYCFLLLLMFCLISPSTPVSSFTSLIFVNCSMNSTLMSKRRCFHPKCWCTTVLSFFSHHLPLHPKYTPNTVCCHRTLTYFAKKN